MFNISWSEMALIVLIALVFVGPKELPSVVQTLARYISKARKMGRSLQAELDAIVREVETRVALDEKKSDLPKENNRDE